MGWDVFLVHSIMEITVALMLLLSPEQLIGQIEAAASPAGTLWACSLLAIAVPALWQRFFGPPEARGFVAATGLIYHAACTLLPTAAQFGSFGIAFDGLLPIALTREELLYYGNICARIVHGFMALFFAKHMALVMRRRR